MSRRALMLSITSAVTKVNPFAGGDAGSIPVRTKPGNCNNKVTPHRGTQFFQISQIQGIRSMEVISNGKSYYFDYQHGTMPVFQSRQNGKRAEYTAVQVIYNGGEYRGIVRKHHKDKSNRVTARTIALLKAIKELPEEDQKFILSTIPIRKDATVSI